MCDMLNNSWHAYIIIKKLPIKEQKPNKYIGSVHGFKLVRTQIQTKEDFFQWG